MSLVVEGKQTITLSNLKQKQIIRKNNFREVLNNSYVKQNLPYPTDQNPILSFNVVEGEVSEQPQLVDSILSEIAKQQVQHVQEEPTLFEPIEDNQEEEFQVALMKCVEALTKAFKSFEIRIA